MVLHFCEQAALRKICSVCGTEGIRPIDHRQLVELQLMDSFLICSNTDEDFVWTVQGNLLTHCCCFLCCFLFICSHTDEDFEQFMATCWLIVFFKSVHMQTRTLLEQFKATCCLIFVCLFLFYLFTHRWRLCLNSSKQLVDSFFIFFYQFSHRWGLWTVQGHLLTHFLSSSSHTDEDFA